MNGLVTLSLRDVRIRVRIGNAAAIEITAAKVSWNDGVASSVGEKANIISAVMETREANECFFP